MKAKENLNQKQKCKDNNTHSNVLEETEDIELLQYETESKPSNKINNPSLNLEQKDNSFDKFDEFIHKLYIEQQKKN